MRVVLTNLGKEIIMEIDGTMNDRISQNLKNENEEAFKDIIKGLQKLNELLRKMSSDEKL